MKKQNISVVFTVYADTKKEAKEKIITVMNRATLTEYDFPEWGFHNEYKLSGGEGKEMKLDELEKLADAADGRAGISFNKETAAFIAAANPQTIKQMIALIRLQHEALKEYSTTIADNQCVDYHVCCGVADDLSHDAGCKATQALSAHEEFNRDH